MSPLSRTPSRPVIILYDKETNAALADRLVLPPPQRRVSLSIPPPPAPPEQPEERRTLLPWKRISPKRRAEPNKRIEPILQTCSLFMRLPAEIREMIFTYTLADSPAVHILHFYQRLGHVQCKYPSGPIPHHIVNGVGQISERCC